MATAYILNILLLVCTSVNGEAYQDEKLLGFKMDTEINSLVQIRKYMKSDYYTVTYYFCDDYNQMVRTH